MAEEDRDEKTVRFSLENATVKVKLYQQNYLWKFMKTEKNFRKKAIKVKKRSNISKNKLY